MNTKLIVVILLVMVASMVMPVAVGAQSTTATVCGTSSLRVRSGPGLENPEVGYLNGGVVVTLNGQINDVWYGVSEPIPGWAGGRYLCGIDGQPLVSAQTTPAAAPAIPASADVPLGGKEVLTQPAPNGQFTVQPGQFGSVWWHVTLNGFYLGDCWGAWLWPGTYNIQSPGRIRIWQFPVGTDMNAVKVWWGNLVQIEAGVICTYSWVEYNPPVAPAG